MAVTRGYLRYRVGRKVGDSIKITATVAGTATTITDTIRLTGAPSVYAGRSVYCESATSNDNVGEWREVVDSVDGVLTVSPPFDAAVAAGDVFQLSDERDRGFSPDEIIEAINDAHIDAGQFTDVRVTAEIEDAFDRDTGEIQLPATMTSVLAVFWQDDDDQWRETHAAASLESDGWTTWPGRTVIVNGPLRTLMDGKTVRVLGYGPPTAFASDGDETDVNPEWLVWKACAQLYEQGMDRDPTRERRAFNASANAARMEPTLFAYRAAGARQVVP